MVINVPIPGIVSEFRLWLSNDVPTSNAVTIRDYLNTCSKKNFKIITEYLCHIIPELTSKHITRFLCRRDFVNTDYNQEGVKDA